MSSTPKPHKSLDEQLELLRSRGLVINNSSSAKHYLLNLNYYRLAGYSLGFQSSRETHQFKSGTQFDDILNLYIFDRELRLLLLDAIERIEVSTRTTWAYYFSEKHGPHAHLSQTHSRNSRWFAGNIESLNKSITKSSEVFVQHHISNSHMLPIWVACEIITFGLLSRFLKNLKANQVQSNIARIYSLDYDTLVSFIEHLVYLRNLCAHHSRVWNRAMVKLLKLPKNKPKQLRVNFNLDKLESRLIYNSLVMIVYFLDIISPDNHFRRRLLGLIDEHNVNPRQMGFPEEWQQLPIWRHAMSGVEKFKSIESFISEKIGQFKYEDFDPNDNTDLPQKFKEKFYLDTPYWFTTTERQSSFALEFKKYGANRHDVKLVVTFAPEGGPYRRINLELKGDNIEKSEPVEVCLHNVWQNHQSLYDAFVKIIKQGIDKASEAV